MSDHFPQFSEQAPRRQFRPKFFLQIDALDDTAVMPVPGIDGNDTPPQQKVIGDTPAYPDLPEDKSTPPPFFPQNKLRAQPFTLPMPKQRREEEVKWLPPRSRVWGPGSFGFNMVAYGVEGEKIATIPVPALWGGVPDHQSWPGM